MGFHLNNFLNFLLCFISKYQQKYVQKVERRIFIVYHFLVYFSLQINEAIYLFNCFKINNQISNS
jgi:hypothetical protein